MPNQIKTCPHRGNMKIVIIVCSLAALARGSLEPIGYKPPGTYPQTRYLPPSKDSRDYVSSPADFTERNFDRQLSTSLSLPLQNEPVPFSNYLPANRQSSEGNGHQMVLGERWTNAFPRFGATSAIEQQFDQTPLRNDYLPPGQQSSKHYTDLSNNNYVAGDQERLTNSYSSPVRHNHYSSNDKSLTTGSSYGTVRETGSNQVAKSYYDHRRNSASNGYDYLSPENQTPAKYEFEYEVKDNYGNDYGHKEIRNGENTQGIYKVLLPDGRRQVVQYEADSHGYRPTITYEEADASSVVRQSATLNNQGYKY